MILQFGQGLVWTACLHSLWCWLKPGQLHWSWSIQEALLMCLAPLLAWLESWGWLGLSLSLQTLSSSKAVSLPLFLYSLSLSCRVAGLLYIVASFQEAKNWKLFQAS